MADTLREKADRIPRVVVWLRAWLRLILGEFLVPPQRVEEVDPDVAPESLLDDLLSSFPRLTDAPSRLL